MYVPALLPKMGQQYWTNKNEKELKVEIMDRKKELKEQYKEMKTEAGIYQIRNLQNQKVYMEATPNLKTINGKIMQLNGGPKGNRYKKKKEKSPDFSFFFL